MPSSGSTYIRERAEAFQRLRLDVLRRYLIPGMALFLAAVAAFLLSAPSWLQLAFFAPSFVLLFLAGNKYRCPVCGRTPSGESGIDVNPRECGHCGTIFRSEG